MKRAKATAPYSSMSLFTQGVIADIEVEQQTCVEYGERAFDQDSGMAMRNDPYVALIEAVTNSDDNLLNREGSIAIAVTGVGKPWKLSVTDSGDGIAHNELHEKLIKLGSRTSGLEIGRSVRGNKGRGARDMASLGGVLFETIHNNSFSALSIDGGGHVVVSKERKASPEIRAKLGIFKNGTRVTITCRSAKKPRDMAMKRAVTNLVALRDILLDPRRTVTLQYIDGLPERLQYVPPSDRKLIGKYTVPVPSYRGKASVVLYQHPKPFDEEPNDVAREGGILIKGGRAVHMSTIFDFEQSVAARRISGEIKWDELDSLIRQYDDALAGGREHSETNSYSIVRRDRQGLDIAHPAFKALKSAVRPILAKEVARLEKEMSHGASRQSEQTKKRFSALGNLLGKFWHSKKDELEERGSQPTGRESRFGLSIIPPRKRLDPYATAALSVQFVCDEELDYLPQVKLVAEVDPPDTLTLSCATLQLERIPENGSRKIYRGNFKVTAAGHDGEAIVQAKYGDQTADVAITVGISAQDVPQTLAFERDLYRLKPNQPKKIRLLAPEWLVQAHGDEVALKSSSPDIVLRKMTLKLKSHGGYYVAETSAIGEALDARAKISATLANLSAFARIVVTDTGDLPKVDVRFDAIPGNQRAAIRTAESGDMTVVINGTHPAASRYLGPAPGFTLADTATACVLVAEIVADEIVQHYLMEKYNAKEVDPTRLEWERGRELVELLPKVHAIMLPDIQLRRAQAGQDRAINDDEVAQIADARLAV